MKRIIYSIMKDRDNMTNHSNEGYIETPVSPKSTKALVEMIEAILTETTDYLKSLKAMGTPVTTEIAIIQFGSVCDSVIQQIMLEKRRYIDEMLKDHNRKVSEHLAKGEFKGVI